MSLRKPSGASAVASITSLMSSCSRHKRRLAVPRIDPERLDALAQRSKFGQRLGREADREAQLAEREPAIGRGSEVGLVLIGAQSHHGGTEHIVRELARFPELLQPRGVDQQPADPQRIIGRETRRIDHRCEVACYDCRARLRSDRSAAYHHDRRPAHRGTTSRSQFSTTKTSWAAASWFGAAKYMLRPSRATSKSWARAMSNNGTGSCHVLPLAPALRATIMRPLSP